VFTGIAIGADQRLNSAIRAERIRPVRAAREDEDVAGGRRGKAGGVWENFDIARTGCVGGFERYADRLYVEAGTGQDYGLISNLIANRKDTNRRKELRIQSLRCRPQGEWLQTAL
jgi:hypothetical protein